MQTSETQIQVNTMSKKNDEINSFDIELPQNLDLMLDIDNLLKDTKIIDQLKKLTSKYVKEEVKAKASGLRKSLLIASHPVPNPFMPPGHGGIPSGGPSGGFGTGGFRPIGGIHDIDPFGGSNLVGPNSNLFNRGGNKNLGDPDDQFNFNPGPYGFGAPPDNDELPNFGFRGKKGGGSGGGFGGFGGGSGTSGGNFYM